ncbi:RING finger protein 145 [Durusdinium trenchii]
MGKAFSCRTASDAFDVENTFGVSSAETYRCQLKRTRSDTPWQMKLAIHREIEGFLITETKQSLAVKTWNDANPRSSIKAGHVILEINGFTDHANMKEQILQATSIDMCICSVLTVLQQVAYEVFEQQQSLYAAVDAIVQPVDVTDLAEGCSICHQDLDARVVRLPCGHDYHDFCIKKWFTTGNHRCPLCNHHLQIDPA